jgi:hypothetical protein
MFPLNLSYSSNRLDRGSLLSEETATSVVLATRQKVRTSSTGVNAIGRYGSTLITLGYRLTDTNVGAATLVNSTVLKSRASNQATNLSAQLAWPLTATSQWTIRAGMDHYNYDAGEEPVFGSRDARSPSYAAGVQGVLGIVAGMAEIGRQTKKSDSPLVPDGGANIGSVNGRITLSPALNIGFGINRLLIETNIPTVFDILADAKSINLNYRVASQWIVQAGMSQTRLEPRPIAGFLKDSGVNSTLMWKPHPRLLVQLDISRKHRDVSDNLLTRVSPYSTTKTQFSITGYP